MPAVSFHGTTLLWSVEGGARDPLTELLAGFAPALGELAGAPSSDRLSMTLRPATAATAIDPRTEGWTPTFFHGVVEAHRGPHGFLIWDRASRVFVPTEGHRLDAEVAAPDDEVVRGSIFTAFQAAFALAFRQRGLYHLHAAALILGSGTPVFVVGRSGAGKTSTTLALLEAVHGEGAARYLGDDALYLTRGFDPVTLDVVAFPRDFHLGASTLETFPRLKPLAGPPPAYGTKRPLDARLAWPGCFAPSFALPTRASSALALFPTVTDARKTTVLPLPRAEAFGNLLGSSGAVVAPGVPGRDENLALLSKLLGAVDCYELRLGADALRAPASSIATRVAELARSR